ncbi:hypothetical protein T484DRAFT_1838587 [Baffinella frigidus]|nr:hypothetical protein T484DRAFT_1838587 [Cryptophyta sp. CCMP2293]
MPAPPRSPVLRVAAAALLALAAAAAVSCLAASSGECRGALGQGRAGRGFAALALMLLPTLAPLGWAGAGAAEGPGATAGTSVGSLPLGTERGLFEKFVVDEGRQGGGARSFSIADDKFVLDGSPVRLIVGELHYFRIPNF